MTERLGWRDLRALQGCVAELYEVGGLNVFRNRVVRIITSIVPGDLTVYAEVDLRGRKVALNQEAEAGLGLRDGSRVFAAHMGDLPLFTAYRRGEASAVKISDFLTQRQFHRTALYNEFYRRIGIEYHASKGLPGPSGLVTAISILRRRKDFTERDRIVLNLLGPHLNQSYRNAATITRLENELALLRNGVEALNNGVVIMAGDGRVGAMTSRARHWIADYFDDPPRGGLLPKTLREWVRQGDAQLASRDEAVVPRVPMRVERGGRHLSVRLVGDGDDRLLLLSERHSDPRPDLLGSLGLSRREAEVLAWVAEGKTNAEVAQMLGTSVRTIDKHLEHVFRKLGVETRTAAASRARAVLQP